LKHRSGATTVYE